MGDQTSLPLYAKLHECDLVMNIPGAPTDPNDPASWMSYERTNLAWFRMPEQGVKHGENDFTFSVPVTVLQPDGHVHHCKTPCRSGSGSSYIELYRSGGDA